MVVKIRKKKGTKKCVMKRKRKFEKFKNFLEATQLDNKRKHLEKNKIDIDISKKIINNSEETIN